MVSQEKKCVSAKAIQTDEFMILLSFFLMFIWNKVLAISSFFFIPLFAYKMELLGGKMYFWERGVER